MSAKKKLDAHTETQIVARIARGDTSTEILQWLEEDKDIKIAVGTITNIKKRNAQALEYMNNQITQEKMTLSTQLLSKSRQLLDKKLDSALNIEKKLSELRKDFNNGELTDQEFSMEWERIIRSELDVKELNAISKESFHQAQLESGKPTQIADNPAQAKANLAVLLSAIKNRDDTAALKAIFPDD